MKTRFDGHTEGPWMFSEDFGLVAYEAIQMGEAEVRQIGNQILEIKSDGDGGSFFKGSSADKSLILAAPALLALVKEIAEYEPPKLEDEKNAEARLFLQNAMSLVAFKGFQKQARELLESD